MSERLEHVVVGVDFSEGSAVALEVALGLARQAGAQLTVVHIDGPELPRQSWPMFFAIAWDDALKNARSQVDKALRSMLARAGVEGEAWVSARSEVGDPSRRLVELAQELDAGLLVVSASSKTTLEQALLGTTAREVVDAAQMPVWVVRRAPTPGRVRVLVGVDGQRCSQKALVWARAQAERDGATLEVAHVYRDPGAARLFTVASDEERDRYRAMLRDEARVQLDAAIDEALGEGVLGVERTLLTGKPAEALAAQASASVADVLVVGTHGESLLHAMFVGSTARRVLEAAPCDVVVIADPDGGA